MNLSAELRMRCPACFYRVHETPWHPCHACSLRFDPFEDSPSPESPTCPVCEEVHETITCEHCGVSSPHLDWNPLIPVAASYRREAAGAEVELPIDRRPVFLDQCVRCARRRPGTAVWIAAEGISWQSWTRVGWRGRKLRFEVPACTDCRFRVRWTATLRAWVAISLALAAVALVVVGLRSAGFTTRAIGVGALLTGLVAWVAAELAFRLKWPVPFDVEVDQDAGTTTYEFGNEAYALQFALVNELERVKRERLAHDLAELAGLRAAPPESDPA